MAVTRRALLNAMARLGGAGAVYETLAIWDFLKPPPALAAGLEIPRESGAGKTVAVLGAGVAGLCAAYELDRAGYDCVILEADSRLGGRSLTVRRGDSYSELGGPVQQCAFEEGLYLNVGPGRIPHHHVHVIDYCRRFGVTVQPFIFASRANLVHTGHLGNGRTMPVRRALYDLQGHVSELLDKCIAKGGIDQPVTGVDLEKLREMLAKFGGLSKEGEGQAAHWVYRNATGRAGYDVPPGLAGEPGKPLSPMALDEILRSQVWDDYIFRDAEYYWQTSLLEPVGGMDNFVKAFARQPRARAGSATVGDLIRYGAKVTAIDVGTDKVAVRYDQGGNARTLTADYCVSTIPMPIFRELRTNLPAAFMRAARALPVQAAGKVGWQADRFWETKDQIYGGISWTTDDITQIWYPSYGYLSRKGTLTGAYLYGEKADRFNPRPVAERLHIAKEQGERLHPGFAAAVEHGLAIAWDRMEFARFAWANEGDPGFAEPARALTAPQGRFHMAGDQITWWSGWQEGAIISAWEAVKSIARQTQPANARP
jgi:monoamine oxidase